MSDAGCPGVADPGAELVKMAHARQIEVVPLIGPSSILMALMASGLSGQNFRFTGYLPIDKKELTAKLLELETQSKRNNETEIFIETPYRSDKMLEHLVVTLNSTTLLTVAKGITGADEKILTKDIATWRKEKIVIGKTPTVFLFLAS
jgi:16S rRNA (cytidine1402-2'-O)-methyltransferase